MALDSINKTILVVDDDTATRFFLSEVFTMAGYKVESAVDGLVGLELLRRKKYDLILTDVNMPRLSGIDFYIAAVKEISSLKEHFIFMTANITMPVWSAISKLNRECLLKPFKITELLSRVDTYMHETFVIAKKEEGNRGERRFPFDAACEILEKDSIGAEPLIAVISDVSGNGLKIKYQAEPLPPGLQISIYAGVNSMNILRGAEVTWSKTTGDNYAVSGLSLSSPVPVFSMIRSRGVKETLRLAG
jgi:CheY-like chemotaxis protein